jgi:uncharacterized protein YfiM (DUF2279 family)
MRTLSFLFTCLLIVIPCSLAILLVLIIEEEPHVVRPVALTPEHIERAKNIINAHRRQANSRLLSRVNILSADLDIAANYLANHFGKGRAQVNFAKRQAKVHLSFPLPTDLVDGYINFAITIAQTNNLPQIQSVQIGNLPLPNFVTNTLISKGIEWLRHHPEYHKSLDAIKFIYISKHEISVLYRREGGFSQIKTGIAMLNEQELAQLFRYQSFLAQYTRRNNTRTISLAELLPPLMQLAAKHSINGDAKSENRAAILVTTLHVLGVQIKSLVPEAKKWPRPISQVVTIDKRNDFAKHFMLSAAITAYTDTVLSDAIGLYKEIEDSRSGSGFSFNDIAADRAGTRFGERAITNQTSARQLQKLVSAGLTDVDLMPPWSDLPESMPEAEFKQRFGGIDTPAYQQMVREIEKRVAALRVLKEY